MSSPAAVVPARRRRPDPTLLPERPAPYHQLLRGPRWRWWRPLLSFLLVVGLLLVALLVVFGASDLLDPVLPDRWVGSLDDEWSPISNVGLDLALAALIPVSVLATAIAHPARPRWTSSVVGGIRWSWLGRCLLACLPVWVLYLGVGFLVDPAEPGRPDHWVLLLVMAVVLTPFQAAGEEYLFRGWLVQNIGGYLARPVAGLVVSTVASAALFAAAHGSPDPYILLSIATLAVAACLANWRTGGLEAGIAMHVVNNVGVGVLTITYGGWTDSFVDGSTTGSPLDLVPAVVVHALAVALILWQGRRAGVRRTTPQPVWTYGPWVPLPTPPEPPEATWIAPLGR